MKYDLVAFWKQNDTGIYGRRSDLLLSELARSGRIGATIQFDAPLGRGALERMKRSSGTDHHRLIFEMTSRRMAGEENLGSISRHTFVFDDSVPTNATQAKPRPTESSEFGDFVASALEDRGIGQTPVVFLVYPTNPHLPGLIDRFRPELVVADIVDDNRTWFPEDSQRRVELTNDYREILDRSDLILANCLGVIDAMAEFHREIHLVPNACEVPSTWRRRAASRPSGRVDNLGPPRIGYVGNLSSRIDVALLDEVAISRPSWNILLIGSIHGDGAVMSLSRHPNVEIRGPVPHREAEQLIRSFDVAIIPHVDNSMTRSMQPLKAFVYCSLGVPVVATSIANLPDLGSMITVAQGAPAFVHAIESALAGGRPEWSVDERKRLMESSWPVRAQQVLRLIDQSFRTSPVQAP